jgi:hypothetical protein
VGELFEGNCQLPLHRFLDCQLVVPAANVLARIDEPSAFVTSHRPKTSGHRLRTMVPNGLEAAGPFRRGSVGQLPGRHHGGLQLTRAAAMLTGR